MLIKDKNYISLIRIKGLKNGSFFWSRDLQELSELIDVSISTLQKTLSFLRSKGLCHYSRSLKKYVLASYKEIETFSKERVLGVILAVLSVVFCLEWTLRRPNYT